MPASWRLLWRDGEEWKPVQLLPDMKYDAAPDRYNRISFAPVVTITLATTAPTAKKATLVHGLGAKSPCKTIPPETMKSEPSRMINEMYLNISCASVGNAGWPDENCTAAR